MNDVKTGKNGWKFLTHRPKDKLDPGFTIQGIKLRWIAAHTTEDKLGRPHRVLRKSDVPDEILKAMNHHNPDMFGQDGTIRNRELVLAYVSDELNRSMRQELNKDAADAVSRIKSLPANSGKHLKLEKDNDVQRMSGADAFND